MKSEQQEIRTSSQSCRLGLVLSGGAARGFAHIGVLRAFEENGIEVDCVSGASSGALIGVFYAAGKTPDEMMDIAKSIKKSKLKAIGPFHFGTAGLDYVEQLLTKHVVQSRFEELHKPLFICATNFQSGRYKIFSSGEILPALRASTAIPIKYGEQIIDGVVYIDGGMVNNLPVEPLRECCRTVIGISINPVAYKSGKIKLRQKIMRLTELALNENEARRIKLCDYHLEVAGLGEIGFEEYDRAREIHDLGYRSAKIFISENPELLTYKC
jgi:NTE family protein